MHTRCSVTHIQLKCLRKKNRFFNKNVTLGIKILFKIILNKILRIPSRFYITNLKFQQFFRLPRIVGKKDNKITDINLRDLQKGTRKIIEYSLITQKVCNVLMTTVFEVS